MVVFPFEVIGWWYYLLYYYSDEIISIIVLLWCVPDSGIIGGLFWYLNTMIDTFSIPLMTTRYYSLKVDINRPVTFWYDVIVLMVILTGVLLTVDDPLFGRWRRIVVTIWLMVFGIIIDCLAGGHWRIEGYYDRTGIDYCCHYYCIVLWYCEGLDWYCYYWHCYYYYSMAIIIINGSSRWPYADVALFWRTVILTPLLCSGEVIVWQYLMLFKPIDLLLCNQQYSLFNIWYWTYYYKLLLILIFWTNLFIIVG